MEITIKVDGDTLINEVMQNYPEASACIRCVRYDYKRCRFVFWDEEDGKLYRVNLPRLRKALPVYLGMLFGGKLPGIAEYVLPDFQDAGNWDMWAVDGLVQVAIFGDVIYG